MGAIFIICVLAFGVLFVIGALVRNWGNDPTSSFDGGVSSWDGSDDAGGGDSGGDSGGGGD